MITTKTINMPKLSKRNYSTQSDKLNWVLNYGEFKRTSTAKLIENCLYNDEKLELKKHLEKGHDKYTFTPHEKYVEFFGFYKVAQFSKNPFTLINVIYEFSR